VRGLCVVVGVAFLFTPVACAGGGEGSAAGRTSGAATGTVYLTWERAAAATAEPGAECRADFAWTADPLDLTGREGRSEAFREDLANQEPYPEAGNVCRFREVIKGLRLGVWAFEVSPVDSPVQRCELEVSPGRNSVVFALSGGCITHAARK